MRTFLLFILHFTIFAGYSQDVDSCKVLATDTLYGHIESFRAPHGGFLWFYRMNSNAPNGYYFVYKHSFDDSTKTYLFREGLFLNGHAVDEWIEYQTNGKKDYIEKWNEKGDTGYRKLFTKKGKLEEYIRWVDGEIVERKCYRKCK